MSGSTERFDFTNSQGQTLSGRLELPSHRARAFAIFAHCFSCNKNVHAASRISRGLRDRGFAVLRFDFTGLGSSEGDFANTNFSSNIDDLRYAAEALRDRFEAPSLLVGHSLGAQHRPLKVQRYGLVNEFTNPMKANRARWNRVWRRTRRQ